MFIILFLNSVKSTIPAGEEPKNMHLSGSEAVLDENHKKKKAIDSESIIDKFIKEFLDSKDE